jgi:hypothetical protein
MITSAFGIIAHVALVTFMNGFVKYHAPPSVTFTVKLSPVFTTVKTGFMAGALIAIRGAFVQTTFALFVIVMPDIFPFKIVASRMGGVLHAQPLNVIFGTPMYPFPAFTISTFSFAALIAAVFAPPNFAAAVMRGARISIFGKVVQLPAVVGLIVMLFTVPSRIVVVAVGYTAHLPPVRITVGGCI